VGARCGSSARRVLCGGRRATGVPTATADGNHRQDPIHEESSGIGHPAAAARGTEPPTLAREGDRTIVLADRALQAQEAKVQDAALEVTP
jgi:hypothetical protein